MKRILIITSGVVHPPLFGRFALRRIFSLQAGFSIQHAHSLEILTDCDLIPFSALVLYIHHRHISPAALDALEGFVQSGGGLLGVHSATASFKQSQRYFELIGGRFSGHGKVGWVEVQPGQPQLALRSGQAPNPTTWHEGLAARNEGVNDPFEGIGGFNVRDELYLHELQPGITVHFTSRHIDRDVPVIWTYHYGQGRVCYASPGHRAASFLNPVYRQILIRGLDWVSLN
jgi:uncharacterized protein